MRVKKKRLDKRYVPYSHIAPVMVQAIIIAEDAKFWRHDGFDFEAIHNAIEKNIETMTFKLGASTITQQLAKNLYLSPSKNPVRKIKEAILTWRIEKTLSKRRILELYLNVIEWGDGIFGVEAASRRYFGISASELSPRQAAALAAVVPNPLRYHPTSNQRYVVRRTEMIYTILVRRGAPAAPNDSRRDSTMAVTAPAVSTVTTELPLDALIDSLVAIDKNREEWFTDSP